MPAVGQKGGQIFAISRISKKRLDVAVVGAGISGMACASLLAQRHRVTLYEAAPRLGGHTHTVDVGRQPVHTGVIVCNETTYPNLVALFDHLGVQTQASETSFAVSLDDGRLEYADRDLVGMFAQRSNLFSPRFQRLWSYHLASCEGGFRAGILDVGSTRSSTLEVRPAPPRTRS